MLRIVLVLHVYVVHRMATPSITILVVMFVSFLYVMATALVVLVVSNVSRYGMTVYDIGDHSLTWRWWTLRYLLRYDAL